MTIREVLINIRERLQNAGIEDFEYESWAFLDWKLHIDRAEFYMNPNGEVKEELLAELESVLKQREQRVPLQNVWWNWRWKIFGIERHRTDVSLIIQQIRKMNRKSKCWIYALEAAVSAFL